MSYDLYFIDPKISLQEFQSYFESRSNHNVENTQAWYANEDTGVYFCFDYSGESEEAPEGHNGNVSFNLNFYRPHFFALEAEPEVRDFVNHFGLMNELAPRRLFRKKEDMCIVAIEKAFPLLESFRAKGYAMPAFALSYTAAPDDVSTFVKSLKPNAGQAAGVANDQVLNRELIAKFRKV